MEMSLLVSGGVRHPAPDVETLTMSGTERDRMKIMAGVKANALSQVQAAELMGLGYRQAKRLWRRYILLNPAFVAIHRVISRAQVAGGGTAPRGSTNGVSPIAWVDGMRAAHARSGGPTAGSRVAKSALTLRSSSSACC